LVYYLDYLFCDKHYPKSRVVVVKLSLVHISNIYIHCDQLECRNKYNSWQTLMHCQVSCILARKLVFQSSFLMCPIKVNVYFLICVLCSNQGTGRWSSDGIIQDNNPNPPVNCRATHLTSFSVLVSSVDASEVCHLILLHCVYLCTICTCTFYYHHFSCESDFTIEEMTTCNEKDLIL